MIQPRLRTINYSSSIMNSSHLSSIDQILEEPINSNNEKVYKENESIIKQLSEEVTKALETVDLISTEVVENN
jgi:thermostable 8-oxoguanine DNA glycosylase